MLLLVYHVPNHEHIEGTTESSFKAFRGVQPKELSHLAQMMVITGSGTHCLSLISVSPQLDIDTGLVGVEL